MFHLYLLGSAAHTRLGWFATKIFHPNVSSAGEICVNTLKKDWQSSYGIGHILVTVKCLLIYPNPESALDEEAGKLLLENYESYCSRAKLITSVHATPKVLYFIDSGSISTKKAIRFDLRNSICRAHRNLQLLPFPSLSPQSHNSRTRQSTPRLLYFPSPLLLRLQHRLNLHHHPLNP